MELGAADALCPLPPNAHYLLALQDLAKCRGLGHLFTLRATPHTRQRNRRAYRSPAKAPQIAPPGANRTPGGLDIPLKERLRLSPRRTSDAMPRQRTFHSIGEATMTWSSREASSHTSTRGESPRAVRSNLLSTCRRGSDGGSPIASLPELSGSLTKRLRGSE